MNILLIGYGRMGKLIEQTAVAAGDSIVGTIDLDNFDSLATLGKVADVVMDFSNPSTLAQVEDYIRRHTTEVGPETSDIT